MRFYDRRTLVKTHPRVSPGQRQTDPTDFPPEQQHDFTVRKEILWESEDADHDEFHGPECSCGPFGLRRRVRRTRELVSPSNNQ